jgi:hypothetical protein
VTTPWVVDNKPGRNRANEFLVVICFGMVWLLLYQGLFIMESDDSLDDFVASDEI